METKQFTIQTRISKILFYEYFHGNNGSRVGIIHQAGWTGLVAEPIDRIYKI